MTYGGYIYSPYINIFVLYYIIFHILYNIIKYIMMHAYYAMLCYVMLLSIKHIIIYEIYLYVASLHFIHPYCIKLLFVFPLFFSLPITLY